MGTVPHAVSLPDSIRESIAHLADDLEFALFLYGRSPTSFWLDEIARLEVEASKLADEIAYEFGIQKEDIMRKIGFPVEGL